MAFRVNNKPTRKQLPDLCRNSGTFRDGISAILHSSVSAACVGADRLRRLREWRRPGIVSLRACDLRLVFERIIRISVIILSNTSLTYVFLSVHYVICFKVNYKKNLKYNILLKKPQHF